VQLSYCQDGANCPCGKVQWNLIDPLARAICYIYDWSTAQVKGEDNARAHKVALVKLAKAEECQRPTAEPAVTRNGHGQCTRAYLYKFCLLAASLDQANWIASRDSIR